MSEINRHEKFNFKSLSQIQEKASELGIALSSVDDCSVLAEPVNIAERRISKNAFAVLPMEGCDWTTEGSLTELAHRRYERFFLGGSGLIWWEACAVVPEGRANPRQMMLTKVNHQLISRLLENLRGRAIRETGQAPLCILQLTHSGRYSRPEGKRSLPLTAQRDPFLDPVGGIKDDSRIVSDDYLKKLVEIYAETAKRAQETGFDGIDVKACHRYLINELLAARTRAGDFGGPFENRSRFILEVVEAIKAVVRPDFIVSSRFNAYDRHPFPYGFGVSPENVLEADLEEPILLAKLLVKKGVELLCVTAGNPYSDFPEITRPMDLPLVGKPKPSEHPLEGVARLFGVTKAIKHEVSSVKVVGSGYSWLRQFIPNFAAANIEAGNVDFVGLGRSSFAYPDAPRDFLTDGKFNEKKCCVSCSRCSQMMRDDTFAGCAIKDRSVYQSIYQTARTAAEKVNK